MDVTFRSQLVFAAISALFISSCQSDKLSSGVTGFQDASSLKCSEDAIPNSFVVYWKDGSVSVEKAADKEAFMNEVMTPNESEIQFAEHDMVLRLPSAPIAAKETDSTVSAKGIVPVDWGQQRLEAPAVWAQGDKGAGTIVAVIDSGVDITNFQLRNQLARNPNEIVNGIDDDGNGLIDDVVGYDFYNNKPEMSDGTGHGTHVSGIILADHSAGSVLGIAPQAKLLPLRFMSSDGSGTVGGAIKSIMYAATRGAKVINASWGASACSQTLRKAVADLESQGVLFVAAAGNEGSNLDYSPEFPAAFSLPGQITVAASTYHEAAAAFSNYSYSLVHVAAPGQEIYSTYLNNRIYKMDGTSMATPFVTGVAAVLFGVRPNATVKQVKAAILAGIDRDPNEPLGIYRVMTGGRVNLRKAVEQIKLALP